MTGFLCDDVRQGNHLLQGIPRRKKMMTLSGSKEVRRTGTDIYRRPQLSADEWALLRV